MMRWMRKKTFRLLACTLCSCSFAFLPSVTAGNSLDLLGCCRRLQADTGPVRNEHACSCPMCRSGAAGDLCACCRHDGQCNCTMSSADDEDGQIFCPDVADLHASEPFRVFFPFGRRVHAMHRLIADTDLTVPAPPPKAKPQK